MMVKYSVLITIHHRIPKIEVHKKKGLEGIPNLSKNIKG
jgi:hypothetical protein